MIIFMKNRLMKYVIIFSMMHCISIIFYMHIRFCESNGCHDYATLSYSFILKKCKMSDLYIIRGLLYIPRLTYDKALYEETFNRIQNNAIYLLNEHKYSEYNIIFQYYLLLLSFIFIIFYIVIFQLLWNQIHCFIIITNIILHFLM